MPVHANSVIAYHSEAARLSARASRVLAWFSGHGPATDREAMAGLGFTEPNAVRPRITELIELGLLREIGNTRCPVTGKTVRRVAVMPKQGSLFE